MTDITIALSKGRIFEDTAPFLKAAGIIAQDDPETSRKLIIATNKPNVRLIMVRASDVPTYVQYGAADLGVAIQEAHLDGLGLAAIAQHVGPDGEGAQASRPPQVEGEASHRKAGGGCKPLDLARHQRCGCAALKHVGRPGPAGVFGRAKQIAFRLENGGHRLLSTD